MKYIVQEEKIKPIKILFADNTIKFSSTDNDFIMTKKLSPSEVEELLAIVFRSPNIIMPKEEYEAKWEYWSGWSGNHDKRIEDATCSKCGYKHSTVRGNPNMLQDYCPCCKSKMKKQ